MCGDRRISAAVKDEKLDRGIWQKRPDYGVPGAMKEPVVRVGCRLHPL
jgi:hypothetical protein